MSSTSPRILIVGVDWMGDVLFSTPLIRAIRKKYPNCYLAYSTVPRCVPVLQDNPHLNAIIPYTEAPFLLNISENLVFLEALRRSKFDEVFLLHRSSTRAFLCALAGIPKRIGYSYKKRNMFLTHRIEITETQVHRIEDYLGLVRDSDIEDDGLHMDFHLSKEDNDEWRQQIKGTGLDNECPYGVLHPGGNWDLKRWPPEYFVEVGKHMVQKGYKIAVCGTQAEHRLATHLKYQIGSEHVVSFCGETSIRTLGSLIDNSDWMLSNDSGPVHMAAALSKPLVAIYGPTSIEVTGPKGLGPLRTVQKRFGCQIPCYYKECHHHVCMKGLKPQMVINSLEDLLSEIALETEEEIDS